MEVEFKEYACCHPWQVLQGREIEIYVGIYIGDSIHCGERENNIQDAINARLLGPIKEEAKERMNGESDLSEGIPAKIYGPDCTRDIRSVIHLPYTGRMVRFHHDGLLSCIRNSISGSISSSLGTLCHQSQTSCRKPSDHLRI